MTPDSALANLRTRIPWRRVRPAISAAAASPPHRFPWCDLEREVVARGEPGLTVVGYGSLMNRASAHRTLAAADAEYMPVIAFRVRRVFDYLMPPSVLARYPTPANPTALAALNAYSDADDASVITGVTCRVPLAALPAFREREVGYDLVPVAVIPYLDLEGEPRPAYFLSCPPEPFDGTRRTDPSLAPHPGYAELCWEGARGVSDEFAALFLATCYLGDRTTRFDSPQARPGGDALGVR